MSDTIIFADAAHVVCRCCGEELYFDRDDDGTLHVARCDECEKLDRVHVAQAAGRHFRDAARAIETKLQKWVEGDVKLWAKVRLVCQCSRDLDIVRPYGHGAYLVKTCPGCYADAKRIALWEAEQEAADKQRRSANERR